MRLILRQISESIDKERPDVDRFWTVIDGDCGPLDHSALRPSLVYLKSTMQETFLTDLRRVSRLAAVVTMPKPPFQSTAK
jgi:hypothetical protein